MDKKLLLILTATATIWLAACGGEPIEPRLQYYVEAQEALAADDFARAQDIIVKLDI